MNRISEEFNRVLMVMGDGRGEELAQNRRRLPAIIRRKVLRYEIDGAAIDVRPLFALLPYCFTAVDRWVRCAGLHGEGARGKEGTASNGYPYQRSHSTRKSYR